MLRRSRQKVLILESDIELKKEHVIHLIELGFKLDVATTIIEATGLLNSHGEEYAFFLSSTKAYSNAQSESEKDSKKLNTNKFMLDVKERYPEKLLIICASERYAAPPGILRYPKTKIIKGVDVEDYQHHTWSEILSILTRENLLIKKKGNSLF